MDHIKIIEKLITRCEECKLKECINCEISWTEVEAIKSLKEKEEFYREWYEYEKREQANRNKQAWLVLSKIKNVDVSELVNLDIEKVLNEIEKEFIKMKGENR